MASSTRKSIPDPVTNRLFALSGNQCAFPGCTNAVTDQVAPGEQPVTLAQRAHIVGVGRQGPRSKAAPLSDDIDSVENLLLLCRLCRCRHNPHYSDLGIMPMPGFPALVAGVRGGVGADIIQRLSRKARSGSGWYGVRARSPEDPSPGIGEQVGQRLPGIVS